MHFLSSYGILRTKQIIRMVSGIGIFHFLVLIVVVTLLLAGIINISLNPEYQIAVAIIWIIAILSIHIRRSDRTFIKIHSGQPFLIHFFEYTLLGLPLIIAFIITKQHLLWPLFIMALFGIAYFQPVIKRQNLNTGIQAMIPAKAFEWKAGMRKFFYPIVAIWLAGTIFSFLEASAPVAIFLIGLLIFSFYETGEPLEMLLLFEAKPFRLIWIKIVMHFTILMALNFPLFALFVLFHPAIWYIPAIILLLMGFVHIYLILLKYAFYAPDTKPAGIEILTSLAFVAFIVPVFMPVIWLLSLRFYFKAIKNLKTYLNDFD